MDIHEYSRSHHHHHDHDRHGHAPHDEAHELVDRALVLSKSWRWDGASAVSLGDLEARVVKGLGKVAEKLAFEDMIVGHIKALLRCGEGCVSYSITRLGDVDRGVLGSWPDHRADDSLELTVNILSLVNTDAVSEAELDRLFRDGEEPALS